MISQRAVDLIVSCEVSSRATYERQYRHPEWPGGASGITIAIGYDLGYASLSKLHADWGDKLPAEMLRVMEHCLGVRGEEARVFLPSVRSKIDVPWDMAMAVFLERDVPQWTAAVIKAIPKAAELSPDSLGALVSLAYNRGASFDAPGDRYREMRAIKMHVQATSDLVLVAPDIRAMKRLWTAHGLLARRDAEAALFEQGLKYSAPAVKPVATETPQPLPKPPAGIKEHGAAGSITIATGTAAHNSAQAGVSAWHIAIIVAAGLITAALIWFAIREYRTSQPVTARQKDGP